MALRAADAAGIAAAFCLGTDTRLTGPIARGQLGQVWRLDTREGAYAVKEWFAEPDLGSLSASSALHERCWAAELPVPEVVRTPGGDHTAEVAGTRVRVLGWLELMERTRRLPPAEVGRLLAELHLVSRRTTEPVIPWHSKGIGLDVWRALHAEVSAAQAPFGERFGALVDALVSAESVIEPPGQLLVCHRDLWSDNVLPARDGRIHVIDFESAGPADPSHELAIVLFEFGLDEPDRVRLLHQTYREAGGPGRVSRRGDFSMLVATLSHLAEFACRRWLDAADAAASSGAEALVDELLDDPVTLDRIDRILAAVQP